MRAIWVQASRPRLSSHIRPSESTEAILSRNPLRRPRDFNDFSTAFLPPTLAAAAIINPSWKEKQTKDWETKLAEVDRQIQLSRAREQEIWARTQLRFIRSGAARQRRCYSTTAEPPTIYTLDHGEELNPAPPEDDEPEKDQLRVEEAADIVPPTDPLLERFERLIAYKLALQMLLQVHVGGNPKYTDIYRPDYFQDRELPGDVSTIVRRLREVGAELATMRTTSPQRLRPRSARPQPVSSEQRRLANLIRDVGDRYKAGKATLPALVERFAFIIMDNPVAPDIRTYTSLIHLFNYVQQEDLSYLVVAALRESSLFLDKKAVHTLLWRYSNSKDLQRFDEFLRELTKTDGRVLDPWHWRRVNGNLIPVPSDFSSLICSRLISAALTCDQIERAEGWATVMAEERPFHIRRLMIMKHFLFHYTVHHNWDKGKTWICSVVEFAKHWDYGSWLNGDEKAYQELKLTIFRILALSATCGKVYVYTTVLQAAVSVDIEPPILAEPRPQWWEQRSVAIIQEWNDAHQAIAHTLAAETVEQRIKSFSEKLSPLVKELSSADSTESGADDIQGLGIISSQSMTSKMASSCQNEIIEQQQILIKNLRDEIALSHRSSEEQRSRIAQLKQQDMQKKSNDSQRIEALQQTIHDSKSALAQTADEERLRLEMVVQQQATQLKAVQQQMAQLAQIVSSLPQPSLTMTVAQESDSDSGYESDASSSSGSWWNNQPQETETDLEFSESLPGAQAEKLLIARRIPLYTAEHIPLPAQSHPSQLTFRQRLILTSVPHYLRYVRVYDENTTRLQELTWEQLVCINDETLQRYGVRFEGRRRKILTDLEAVSKLSEEHRNAIREETLEELEELPASGQPESAELHENQALAAHGARGFA